MKKITLALFAVASTIGSAFSQVNINYVAPPINSSTQLRLPNGLLEHKFLKGVMLIRQSELAGMTGNVVNSIGFKLYDGTGTQASVGNFTIHLQNTTDNTYLKGTNFTAAIVGMTQHYSGAFTVPVSTAAQTVVCTLSSSFIYTGGGVYVAYEWEEVTPVNNTNNNPATWAANNAGTGNGLCVTASSSVTAPNTLGVTDFRPSAILNVVNTATNEVGILDMYAPGKVAKTTGGHYVVAHVQNNSTGVLTNVPVSLNVTGANTFNDVQTLTTMNPGAIHTVTFSLFNPANTGLNTMTVSLPSDQNTANNMAAWSQSVSCNEYALRPIGTNTLYTQFTRGAGASASGLIYSIEFTPLVNTNLSGVKVIIPSFANAANLGKVVYASLQDGSGNIVATGANITITAGMMDAPTTLAFNSPVAVTANTRYLVGVGMPANGYFPIGTLATGDATVAGFYSSPTTGGPVNVVPTGYASIEAVISATNLAIGASASPSVVCKGQTATLTATGPAGATYTWSPGSLTSSMVTVTPNLPGTQTQVVVNYNVNGTDVVSQCPLNTGVVSVTVNAVPNIGVNSKTICIGSKAVIIPTGAATYTIEGGTYTVQPTTTTQYTVIGTNALGCVSTTAAVSKITVDPCSGINEAVANGSVRMYPNPATAGHTKISGLQGRNTITVFNTLGQAVITETSNDTDYVLDLSKYAAGNYMVRIVSAGNEVQTLKLLNK